MRRERNWGVVSHEEWFVYAVTPIDFDWERLGPCTLNSVPESALAAARGLGWEGDVRGNDCGTFMLPDPDSNEFRQGYVWKQENNGTCFIVSPRPLAYLEEQW